MKKTVFSESSKIYYDEIRDIRKNADFIALRDSIYAEMEDYKSSNPDLPFLLYKARLYELVAERFQPKIFPCCPFYFEMGLKNAKSLGGGLYGYVSMWGADLDVRRARNLDFIKQLGYADNDIDRKDFLGVAYGPVFDEDHHCPGYTKVFEKGLSGIIADIDAFLATEIEGSESYIFRTAAKRGLLAMIRAAERFSEEAERLLSGSVSGEERKYLEMIADTAKRVPKNPPKSFYEGLCALMFMYEVIDSFEGLGMSVLGHADRLLGPLYEADIESGRLTREQAEELMEIWLAFQDIKCDSRNDSWTDNSCTLELGGCDENGETVFNEVTKMILRLHAKSNLVNPKLNCRVCSESPEEYLNLLSHYLLRGHNVIALLNDDAIIPALVATGKELTDARLYANGGCQETMVEGCEHSAGVMFYFNLPRVLDLSLNGINDEGYPEEIRVVLPKVIKEALSFEDFYGGYLENMKSMLRYATESRRAYGKKWGDSHPSPIFSATLKGCVESGRDFTKGGAKYNVATACGIGFATLADSLYAIKRAVYDEKIVSLKELSFALASDFYGAEDLRARLISYPKFGHGDTGADEFAGRVFSDINNYIETLDNERGGKYVFSTFTYGNHLWAAPYVRATADGRRSGEIISQSTGPSRIRGVESLTDAIRAQGALPLKKSGGISVLDVMLPTGTGLTEKTLSATIRTFCLSGGQALQPNRVTRERMIEAKKEPDKHRDLIVRVCGLSVYFVNLSESFQDDMIARNQYSC